MLKFSTKMLLLKHPMETHTLRPSFYRQREKSFAVEHPNIVQAEEADSVQSFGDLFS